MTKIAVVAPGGTELLDFDQIHYVQADGDYSRVHTYDRSYLSTSSLGELAAGSGRPLRPHPPLAPREPGQVSPPSAAPPPTAFACSSPTRPGPSSTSPGARRASCGSASASDCSTAGRYRQECAAVNLEAGGGLGDDSRFTREELLRRSAWLGGGLLAFGGAGRLLAGGAAEAGTSHTIPKVAVHHFLTRPDLRPPVVTVLHAEPAIATAILFLAPSSGPGQRGVLILDGQGEVVFVPFDHAEDRDELPRRPSTAASRC